MKNTVYQTGKFVIAALLGSILWAGCASTSNTPNGPKMVESTINLQTTGPDANPQWRTGLYDFNNQNWDVDSIK
jgi:hypothetical protein